MVMLEYVMKIETFAVKVIRLKLWQNCKCGNSAFNVFF